MFLLLLTNIEMQLISQTTLFIIISRQKFSVCFTEDVSVMCNLSLGIEERAEARGEARGKLIGEKKSSEKIIMNMYNNKFTLEQISLATQKSIHEIKEIIKQKNSAVV
jgi:hypothetical protein